MFRHPIHNLVQYHAPDDIILALLSAQKDAARNLDTSTDVFPLHHAIEYGVHEQIILALLEAHEEAAQIKGVDGELPLLMAIKSNCSVEVVLAILSAYKDAAWNGADAEGRLPIYHLQIKSSNEVVLALLIEIVRSPLIQKWEVLNDIVQLKGEDLVLQVAEGVSESSVRHGILCNAIDEKSAQSDDVVIILLTKFRETAKMQDANGNFPLHLAITTKRSVTVVRAVLKAYTQAAKVVANLGNLPLHLALRSGYEKCDDFLMELLSANRAVAAVPDDNGDLPLHLALELHCSDLFVLALLKASPKEANIFMSKSSKGDLPLHVAIKNAYSDQIIYSILQCFPEQAAVKDPKGDFPLYTSISMKRSDKIILALLRAYPGATKETSTNGDLPLHEVIRKCYADEVIINVFAASPCATMIRCQKTGVLPLHLAAASTASPFVVETIIKKYPEALEKVANGATPSDLVSSALPSDSIEMICKPVSYWKTARFVGEDSEEMGKISEDIARMSGMLAEVGKNLYYLNAKVDASQNSTNRIDGELKYESKAVNTLPASGRPFFQDTTLQLSREVPNSALTRVAEVTESAQPNITNEYDEALIPAIELELNNISNEVDDAASVEKLDHMNERDESPYLTDEETEPDCEFLNTQKSPKKNSDVTKLVDLQPSGAVKVPLGKVTTPANLFEKTSEFVSDERIDCSSEEPPSLIRGVQLEEPTDLDNHELSIATKKTTGKKVSTTEKEFANQMDARDEEESRRRSVLSPIVELIKPPVALGKSPGKRYHLDNDLSSISELRSDEHDSYSVLEIYSTESGGTIELLDEFSDACLDRFFCLGSNPPYSTKSYSSKQIKA